MPYFTGQATFQESSSLIREFISELIPIEAFIISGNAMEENDISFWEAQEGAFLPRLKNQLSSTDNELEEAFYNKEQLSGSESIHLLGLSTNEQALIHAISYENRVCGFLIITRVENPWTHEEISIINTLCQLISAAFAVRISMSNEQRNSFVFDRVLDGIKASIYITDIQTDRILFMNQTMRDDFSLNNPIGKVCYKVLQRGIDKRCRFCPVHRLTEHEKSDTVVQWDEINTITGRSYHNYDSLIHWTDGRLVHLQQSIDVTELKTANTDELTQLLSRRPGKMALEQTLEKAREDDHTITVCFYDINNLKIVNDNYGHREGDKLISTIANSIRDVLHTEEYAFRMSGDEFVVVFFGTQSDAHRRLLSVQDRLAEVCKDYDAGFCYGLVEVTPDKPIGAEAALLLADERMYEQKRNYHIIRNERLHALADKHTIDGEFIYDSNLLYPAIIKSTDEYPFICNMKTGIFRYSPAMVKEFGLPGEVIENAAAVWGSKVHPDDKASFLESNQQITDGRAISHCIEYRAKNTRNQWVWVRCRGSVEMDEYGEPSIFAGFITNLGKKNNIDGLTGLFNRREFEDQLQQHINSTPNAPLGVMILGIDDLKHINDLYDHAFGDEVIRVTTRRLQSLLPADVFLFRLDGDEFGLIALGYTNRDIQKLYSTISYSFDEQQEYDGKRYYCTFSGGSIIYPQDAIDCMTALKYANYAMEYAKRHGKKCCIPYSKDILENRARALEMVESLRASIQNDFEGFSIKYQPLVDATTGKLVGAEALARWHSDRFGHVSPDEFIPLLEQTGMILTMGKWVLRTALHQCVTWIDRVSNFVLDVNLSYLQIRGTDFVPYVFETLKKSGYRPENLVLELTESHFAQENDHILKIFKQLRDRGVRVAMDDFGTGYSSLSILKQAPADVVKIDKAFIKDISVSTFDATFIRFVVALCHDVGISVCLEGVETQEEYLLVRSMGLDMIQGYLFGKPVTPGDFEEEFLPKSQGLS